MKNRLLGTAKTIARKTIPAALRLKAWNLYGRYYFERSSIRTIVTYATASRCELSTDVRQLIELLDENSHQADYALIKTKLGLDFKGYSCQNLIAYLYFNGMRSGFFIDIGAFDGVEISNT